MNHLTDVELVEQARTEGDKRAFGLLLERYQAGALRMAQRMIAHEDVAREVVQEAMLQAYLSLAALEYPARFQSWLYGIVLNLCRNHLRSKHHAPLSIEALLGGCDATELLLASHEPDLQTMVEMRELQELVVAAIATLSPQNQQATYLYYYEQLSLRDISLTLGISMSAVKGRLHKSRRQLAHYFSTFASYESWLPSTASPPPALSPTATVSIQERQQSMIEVQLVDVILMEMAKDNENAEGKEASQAESKSSPLQEHYVLILLDETTQRILPIWVGPFEGHSIAIHLLNDNPVPRPLTYDFMASLLKASTATLEEVHISSLQSNTYYATAKLRVGESIHEIDARPSDAIALALRMKSRIYVAEDILAQAGSVIPDQHKGQQPRKGLTELAAKLETMKREYEETMAKFKQMREQEDAKKIDSAKERLFARVFGE